MAPTPGTWSFEVRLKELNLPFAELMAIEFIEAAPELVATLSFSDADIDALVAERTQAKKSRNFARADAIRNDLLAKGILIEDSKEGVRWKRK